MIVFGNSDFIANNRLQAFGNQTLFANSINWVLDRNNLLNIPTRKLESYQIVISERDLRHMLYYFLFVPAIFMIMGLFVFLIRRH